MKPWNWFLFDRVRVPLRIVIQNFCWQMLPLNYNWNQNPPSLIPSRMQFFDGVDSNYFCFHIISNNEVPEIIQLLQSETFKGLKDASFLF